MPPEELENASKSEFDDVKSEIKAAKEDARQSAKKETFDRGTVVAFSLLFILPAVIIVLSLLFFLPFMIRSIERNPDPSGATTIRSNSQP